tara:strand:+ start:1461 stop:4067 length:2607 start_codon:yes stop_codon:yes gene_type:complete
MSELKLFREVPKSADFHSVVMTTFSFDFHHFESQVLRELKRKGVTNVNLFADTAMLDKSIGFSTGHLKSLSTSYSINSIPCTGAFHPKITILAGENDVLLLQGSGNITNGGHGKNHELFTVFYANKEDQIQLPIIQEAWLYLRRLTNKIEGISSEKLDWVNSNCNLLNEIKIKPHQFSKIDTNFRAALLYNEETSIWQQLKELVPTVSVNNIKIFSPFYDEKGILLRRLSAQYNNCTIDAYLQPNRGIHPFKMEELDEIRFISWESTNRAKETTVQYDRKLHSKLFWFDAGEDQYCLIGSPNATIAAFGTETKRGANDEFAVLIKVSDKQILKELKLTGEVELLTPTENIDDQVVEKEIENDQAKNIGKIKLLGVDQDGKNVTLFIQNKTILKNSILAFYDNWGQELERLTLDVTIPKIRIEIKNNVKENTLAFVQFIDSENESLSNKQVVNKLHELWNTNPSAENRRLMKLGSLIESGNGGVFDIVEFYNTIQSSRKHIEKKVSGGSGGSNENKNDRVPSAASLTYEEAILFNKETVEHQKILKQHSSIRIWDSIEKYFKELANAEEDEDMDDEEEGDATTSRTRSEKKERTFEIPLNSSKVLHKRRTSIEKFLTNYAVGLNKSIIAKDHQIGLVDMAMFLIVMKHLIQFTARKVIFKESADSSYEDVLYPLTGKLSELSNFSGATLNLLGAFVNLLCRSQFENGHDEYTQDKLIHYQILVRRTSLFSLAIIGEIYHDHDNGTNWADLLAYNIINKCGDLEIGFEKHLSEFLKNTSINRNQEDALVERIQNWQIKSKSHDYFTATNLGICNVIKRIPSEGTIKFLKLSRPGFEYNIEEKDFILSQLYNCTTHELQPSLQSLKKSRSK